MRIPILCFLILLLGLGMYSCSKRDTEFKSFLNGQEIIYPGVVANVQAKPGNLRAELVWNPSPDPAVTRYVVYWNNKRDSVVVTSNNHKTSDSIKVIVPNLEEYIYSFTIFSYDNKGNRSIPLEINNVKVYGPAYQTGLLNRSFDTTNPYVVNEDGSVRLNFLQQDTSSHNLFTVIQYTNRSGTAAQIKLLADSQSITLPSYKAGSTIQFKSAYIPVKSAIDTFYTGKFDSFPALEGLSQCNKSLFKEVHLQGDAGTYESGTSISKLWDNSQGPQSYPNIFHSDGDHPLPHAITFDLGKVYRGLAQIEEVGRDCCNNPDDFEIWGITDLTNAATTLSPNNAGWPAEAMAKGWTLLKEVKRTDDGRNALKVNLNDNLPPVRYIRIRVKHVTSGDSNYSNMSELTFWNNVFN